MIKTIINIDGMHCAACSAAVEKSVGKLKGVDSVSVNLTAGNALICFDENSVTVDEMIKAVNNAGFIGSIPEIKERVEIKKKAEKETRNAKLRLTFSVLFAIPLFYVSMGHMLGAPLPSFIDPTINPLSYALTQFLFCVPVLISGFEIFKNAVKAGIHKSVNMDTLISLGSAASFFYSICSLIKIFNGHPEYVHQLYFESAGLILTFILIGRYLESASKKKTNNAVEKLLDLSPETAFLIVDGKETEVASASLKEGNIVSVKSGMTIPVDGKIVKGHCAADESMLTGESLPVEKNAGDNVFGGTINTNGYVEFVVTADITSSSPAKIAEYVSLAQTTKAPIANLANKIASVFVPVVMGIAVVSALIWLLAGESPAFALKIFVCVLVISCPCSLGLATPTALTVSMGSSASNGLLIKNSEAIERLAKINTVIFDKTGTITKGKPEVVDFCCFNGFSEKESVSLFAAAEIKSSHPLALAVSDYCNEREAVIKECIEFNSLTGLGLECIIENRRVICGNQKLMINNNVDLDSAKSFTEKASKEGKTVVFLAVDGILAAGAVISDSLRDRSAEVIESIKALGIKTVMLTGDNKKTAESIAERVMVDEVYAELLPEDKLDIVNNLKESGNKVVMVGDGINDAPSLAAADVGIAIGNGTDIAIESADIVLLGADLEGVYSAVKISRRTMKIIKQNLFWAFAYNCICIPVAAGLLYPFGGPLLNPMIGAAAMSLSSVTVVSNSLRLRKIKK